MLFKAGYTASRISTLVDMKNKGEAGVGYTASRISTLVDKKT